MMSLAGFRSCVKQHIVTGSHTPNERLESKVESLVFSQTKNNEFQEGKKKKANNHHQYYDNDNDNELITKGIKTLSAAPAKDMTFSNSYEGSFRAMSFNLRYDTEADGLNAWNYRKDLVASTILFHRPDVFGVQEAKHHQMSDLAERLREFGWVGAGRDDGDQGGEYSAVFYRKSAFDIVDSGTFWLSETPEVIGSRSWESACVRICSWIRLRLKLKDVSDLFVFNSHFDHKSYRAREQAALLLTRHIPKIVEKALERTQSQAPISIVVMGDFNDEPHSNTYKNIVGTNVVTPPLPEGAPDPILPEIILFNDARENAKYKHNADAGSFTDWIHRPEEHTKSKILIDYILYYGNLEPQQFGIICELGLGGKQASDHRPIVADFNFNHGVK